METNIFMLEFLYNIDIFLLILVRIAGFFILLPIFSGNTIPTIAKIMFLIPLSFMVYATGVVTEVTYGGTLPGIVFLILKEFVVGISISFVIYTVFTVMYMAGQLIDQQIGFSMVSVMDPVNQIQVPVTGNLFYMLMMMLLIQTGGFNSLIAAIYRSFDVLPIGQAAILGNAFLPSYILSLITDYIYIGVQIALPIIGTILVIDVALGLLVKASPQMNIFVVGMPIKLLIGLVILYVIVPIFSNIYDMLFDEAIQAVIDMIRGLLP